MKLKHIILFGITFALCGNTFAYSPYANTITNNLQKKSFLTAASFPTTAADATFVERVENKRVGYEPYFDRSAFAGMSIEEQDELESMAYRAELNRLNTFNNSSLYTYCQTYPDTPDCNGVPIPTTPSRRSGYLVINNNDDLYMSAALTPENISAYNLALHNGGCTPPEYSTWASNKILTSGQYQFTSPSFEKFMITAFRKEGDCVNDPNDRGGYTCYGCASNGLCRGVDMSTITRAKVEEMAYTNLFRQYNLERLPDAFRGYALWGIWDSGAKTGIKQFQSALGVQQTGTIDDATVYAAEHYTGDFADAYTKNREQFLRNIVQKDPTQKKFLNGWLNALELLRPSGCHVVPTNPITR